MPRLDAARTTVRASKRDGAVAHTWRPRVRGSERIMLKADAAHAHAHRVSRRRTHTGQVVADGGPALTADSAGPRKVTHAAAGLIQYTAPRRAAGSRPPLPHVHAVCPAEVFPCPTNAPKRATGSRRKTRRRAARSRRGPRAIGVRRARTLRSVRLSSRVAPFARSKVTTARSKNCLFRRSKIQ